VAARNKLKASTPNTQNGPSRVVSDLGACYSNLFSVSARTGAFRVLAAAPPRCGIHDKLRLLLRNFVKPGTLSSRLFGSLGGIMPNRFFVSRKFLGVARGLATKAPRQGPPRAAEEPQISQISLMFRGLRIQVYPEVREGFVLRAPKGSGLRFSRRDAEPQGFHSAPLRLCARSVAPGRGAANNKGTMNRAGSSPSCVHGFLMNSGPVARGCGKPQISWRGGAPPALRLRRAGATKRARKVDRGIRQIWR
jgi:hypothetical protein